MAQLDPNIWNGYARYYAQWLGFPDNFFIAQAMKESSYNPNTGYYSSACNPSGACGILQLRKISLDDMRRFYDLGQLNVRDPYQSLVLSAAYITVLDYYVHHYTGYDALQTGDWKTLAVAYNGGFGAGVSYVRYGQAPSSEGRYYVAFINNALNQMG